MEPIGPIGGAADRITPAQLSPARTVPGGLASSGAAASASSATISSQTMSIQSSQTSITQVSSQVDTFLNALGADLQNNELLRMVIGLLILQLLLGMDGEGGGRGGNESGALARLSSSSQSSRMLLVQSSTSVVQFDYAATELSVASGMQSSAGAQPDGDPGEQIDLSA